MITAGHGRTPGDHESLEAEIRDILERLYDLKSPLIGEDAVAELMLAARAYAARQVEKHARPYPWPPQRNRTDVGQAEAREQRQDRRSA